MLKFQYELLTHESMKFFWYSMLFILSETSTCSCGNPEGQVGGGGVGNGGNIEWKEKCDLNGKLLKKNH